MGGVGEGDGGEGGGGDEVDDGEGAAEFGVAADDEGLKDERGREEGGFEADGLGAEALGGGAGGEEGVELAAAPGGGDVGGLGSGEGEEGGAVEPHALLLVELGEDGTGRDGGEARCIVAIRGGGCQQTHEEQGEESGFHWIGVLWP